MSEPSIPHGTPQAPALTVTPANAQATAAALTFRLCTAADKPALVAFMDAHWGSKHPLMHCDDFFAHYYESDCAADAANATSSGCTAEPFHASANASASAKTSAAKNATAARNLHAASEASTSKRTTKNADAHETATARPLQFAVAEEAGQMLALAGYIWSTQAAPRDIWVSIWCAVKGKNGAGLELMAALPSLTGARVMACNNIRPKTMPFYTFLGYTAARLPHFYRLADKPLADYTVARVAQKRILPVLCADSLSSATLVPIAPADSATLLRRFAPNPSLRPHKDAWYVARRYFAFPRQQYNVYGVVETQTGMSIDASAYQGNKPAATCGAQQSAVPCTTPSAPPANKAFAALLITRTVPVNGTAVLRIVDYIGAPERFAALGSAIDALLQSAGAEYAECYCYGIAPEIFAAAGFCERTEQDVNIIPNYLTPPLYENTEYYFFTSDAKEFTMFKADGDQDRPNLMV